MGCGWEIKSVFHPALPVILSAREDGLSKRRIPLRALCSTLGIVKCSHPTHHPRKTSRKFKTFWKLILTILPATSPQVLCLKSNYYLK